MIRIFFRPPGPPELLQALKKRGPQIAEILRTKLTALIFQLQSKAVAKLSGQVLNARTGILRGSVRAIPAEYADGGKKIVASIVATEGPAFYGRVHEHGGSRAYEIMSVKGRALKFLSHGKTVYAKNVMRPPAMQRAFMKPTELENADWIRVELEAILRAEIEKP